MEKNEKKSNPDLTKRKRGDSLRNHAGKLTKEMSSCAGSIGKCSSEAATVVSESICETMGAAEAAQKSAGCFLKFTAVICASLLIQDSIGRIEMVYEIAEMWAGIDCPIVVELDQQLILIRK